MTAMMTELVEVYRSAAARAGSQIEWHAPSPIIGAWDRLSIEQVLDNLLSNAIRYGEGKPVRLSLSREPTGIVIRVADQGVGIAPEDCSRIFESFERAVGARSSGGFGLGLWLARRLTEAQNGTVTVESEPGVGSEFTVRLPISVIEEPEAEAVR
jgi:signal transduction histidine kinase